MGSSVVQAYFEFVIRSSDLRASSIYYNTKMYFTRNSIYNTPTQRDFVLVYVILWRVHFFFIQFKHHFLRNSYKIYTPLKLNTLLYNLYFIILLWAHCSCSCCCQLQNIFPRNSLYNILYIICAEVYLDKVLLRLYLSIFITKLYRSPF